MTAPAVTAWAIKAPDGEISLPSIRLDAGASKETVGGWGTWWEMESDGYRCVKVHITEMEDGK